MSGGAPGSRASGQPARARARSAVGLRLWGQREQKKIPVRSKQPSPKAQGRLDARDFGPDCARRAPSAPGLPPGMAAAGRLWPAGGPAAAIGSFGCAYIPLLAIAHINKAPCERAANPAPHLPSGDATYCLAKTACPSPATPPVAVHLHFLMFIRMPVNMQKISSPSTTDCADRTSHWYRLTSSAKQAQPF